LQSVRTSWRLKPVQGYTRSTIRWMHNLIHVLIVKPWVYPRDIRMVFLSLPVIDTCITVNQGEGRWPYAIDHLLSISVCTLQGISRPWESASPVSHPFFCSTCRLGLGWISILFTEKRQALCDLGAKTVVMVITATRMDGTEDSALPDTHDTLHSSSDQDH
jgi:hypothetical protein